jgi:hypothetical protein
MAMTTTEKHFEKSKPRKGIELLLELFLTKYLTFYLVTQSLYHRTKYYLCRLFNNIKLYRVPLSFISDYL